MRLSCQVVGRGQLSSVFWWIGVTDIIKVYGTTTALEVLGRSQERADTRQAREAFGSSQACNSRRDDRVPFVHPRASDGSAPSCISVSVQSTESAASSTYTYPVFLMSVECYESFAKSIIG